MPTPTPSLGLLGLALIVAPVLAAEELVDRASAAAADNRPALILQNRFEARGLGLAHLPGPDDAALRPGRERAHRLAVEDRRRCRESQTVLCLLDHRFRVEASWSAVGDGRGAVRDGRVSDSTGLLRPFLGSDVKMLVTMLDACGVRGRAGFWVFAAAPADLRVALSITDTVTGRRQDYLAPGGVAGSTVVDVTTFNDCR